MNVARHNLAKAVGYADKRPAHIFRPDPAGPQKCPVRCPLKPAFYRIASHPAETRFLPYRFSFVRPFAQKIEIFPENNLNPIPKIADFNS